LKALKKHSYSTVDGIPMLVAKCTFYVNSFAHFWQTIFSVWGTRMQVPVPFSQLTLAYHSGYSNMYCNNNYPKQYSKVSHTKKVQPENAGTES
jgi:hypothetical protein